MRKIGMASLILIAVVLLAFTGCLKAKGPVQQLTVEIFDRGTDGGRSLAYDNAWTKWIKEKALKDLNIEVTFVPVSRWQEDTDIVNLMASASAPDLCYTYNLLMINNFRDQGGLLDLSPYVDSHLPEMKKLLGSDPALNGQQLIFRDRNQETGAIFSIPSYRVNLPRRNLFIRKDWLDKLGLPLPKTKEEFHNALIAFRDKDPGNVGRNLIPLGQDSDARWGLGDFIQSFQDPKLGDREFWITRWDDRPIAVPGYKEGVRMMNKWYNEGLLFRDFPLWRVPDDYFNLLKTGYVGAFSANWDLPYRTDYKINEELARNVPGAEFVPIDCIESSNGVTRKEIFDKPGLRIFIPSYTKNRDAALRYLNWLCKFEIFNFLQIGQEGINHEIVNGVPRTLTTEAGHEWFQNSSNNIDYTMQMNGVELLDPELNARVLAFGYGNIPFEVIVNAISISTANGWAPPVSSYAALTKKDGIYAQTMRDKADALLVQAITAKTQDFDRVWDAGMRDYLASGGQEVMDERASLWK